METTKLFETATRTKMRFPFKGQISVEDLWDLTISNIDTVFKELNSQVKNAKEESLLNTKTSDDVELDNKIEIVKYIFGIKVAERDQKLAEREKAAQKQKISSIIYAKQEQELQNKSTEELQKMLDDLD